MYTLYTCAHPSCRNTALSEIDADGKIQKGIGFCLEHSKNPQAEVQRIKEYINSHEKIVGLCAVGIHFDSMDFRNKRFYGCNFQHCSFSNIHSDGCRIRISMFDFSVFSDCMLIQSNIQFASFAGASLSHVLFTNSDLVHNNFCGLTSCQSSFDDSDLYNSRFIRAKLDNTSFRNCNLKNAVFYESACRNVSFKLSNTREAKFSAEPEEIE